MAKTRGSKTQKKAELLAGGGNIQKRTSADGTIPDSKLLNVKVDSKSVERKKSGDVFRLEVKVVGVEKVAFGERKGPKKTENILSKRKKTTQRKSEFAEKDELNMKEDISMNVTENNAEHVTVGMETSKSASGNTRKPVKVLSYGRRTTADTSGLTNDRSVKGRTFQVKETHRQRKATKVDRFISHMGDKNQAETQSADYKTEKESELKEKNSDPDLPKEVGNQNQEEKLPIPRYGSVKNEADNGDADSIMVMTEDSISSDSEFEEVGTHQKHPEQFSLHFSSKSCQEVNEDSLSDFENLPRNSASFTSGSTMGFSFTSSSITGFTSGSTYGTSGFTSPSYSATGSDSRKSNQDCLRGKAATTGRKTGKSISQQKTVREEKKAGTTKTGSTAGKGKDLGTTKTGCKRPARSSKMKSDQNKSNVAMSPKKQKLSGAGEGDIMALLMQMEGHPQQDSQAGKEICVSSSGQPSSSRKACKRKSPAADMLSSDSNEESDWEEVEDHKHSPVKSQIPDAPVQVTITDPSMMIHKKRKKKAFDWAAYVQRRINRMAKEIQVDMHKVHLLCLLAHSMQQNSVCCDVTLCATALSIIPMSQLKKSLVSYNPESLVLLVRWFRSIFSLTKAPVEESHSVVSSRQLINVINNGSSSEARLLVMVMVSLIRAIGFNVRLVMSLHPLQLKASQSSISKSASTAKKRDAIVSAHTGGSKKSTQSTSKGSATKNSTSKPAKSKSEASEPPNKNRKDSKAPVKLKAGTKPRMTKKKKSTEELSSSESDSEDGGLESKRRVSSRPRKNMKSSARKTGDSDDCELSSATEGSNFSSDEKEELKKKKVKQRSKGKALSKQYASKAVVSKEDSEDEFDTSMDVKLLKVKDSKQKKNRKVLSSDSSPDTVSKSKLKSGLDYWLEVFLPAEGKWICVDCIKSVVNKPYSISGAASQPLLYVLGIENDGSVKDITARYAPQWLSHTRKQRVDCDWWREALEPYATENTANDDRENEIIKNNLIERPLPTNIGDFKNHPLYALRRHLLKYEAVYPESSIPVGYIRGEPIYARECVHTLHSRDNWLREARLVRLGETAYKMVKSRKQWKRGRDMNSNPDEPDLELFGRWQTEDFIPPPAVNGKVPKNEYGNVELFQPSMLPGGTVHIRVPALNRVAKKLGIDIAAAMTGWDHHCGFSHPVLDGWIVCEEHKDILMAAWEEDQENQRRREEEKREKRVLNNWTTLARGLLIKERLKKKFNLEDKTAQQEVKKVKHKKGEKATDLRHAWPAKQQHTEKSKKETPLPQASHFEVETM